MVAPRPFIMHDSPQVLRTGNEVARSVGNWSGRQMIVLHQPLHGGPAGILLYGGASSQMRQQEMDIGVVGEPIDAWEVDEAASFGLAVGAEVGQELAIDGAVGIKPGVAYVRRRAWAGAGCDGILQVGATKHRGDGGVGLSSRVGYLPRSMLEQTGDDGRQHLHMRDLFGAEREDE